MGDVRSRRGAADMPPVIDADTTDAELGRLLDTDKHKWLTRRTWRVARPLLIALYTLKALESFGYFVITISLTVFLSDEVGFDDMDAGWIYGGFGVATSVLGVLCGPVIDRLGVRKSIILGGLVSLVGRLLIALPISPTMTLVNLLFVLPLGISLGIPVMTIAVKRYTNSSIRVDGFTFFYMIMNVSALVAGFVTDAIRHGASSSTVVLGVSFTPLRLLFLVGWFASIAMVVVAYFGLDDVCVGDDGAVESFDRKLPKETVTDSVRDVCNARPFWILMLYSAVISFARMVFRHLDATFPKYMLREFGANAPYGRLYSLNPLIVIISTVYIGKITSRWLSAYTVCIVGTLLTALSVVPLLFGASYPGAVAFIVLLSVGESAYSPRVYEIIMDMAPEGREGFYTSLASAPFFVAKLFVGGLSGGLLDTYCPPDPPRRCELMWLVVGAVTMLSPILLVALRPIIEGASTGDKPNGDEQAGAGAGAGAGGAGEAAAKEADNSHPEERALLGGGSDDGGA